MDAQTSVEIAELRSALTRILDAAQEKFGPTIELAADHYWLVDAGAAFDLSREPAVVAGQISDDVRTLRENLQRVNEPTIIWHDLEHLIGVLRRVAALDLR